MLFNRSRWAYSAALVVATLVAEVSALPNLGIIRDDYLIDPNVPGTNLVSYSAIINVLPNEHGLMKDAELASVAKEAMRQISANLGGQPTVVSVMQDATTQKLYIGSSTTGGVQGALGGGGMWPPETYVLNQHITQMGGHRTNGKCGECNVLRLMEDEDGNVQTNAGIPSAGSRIVAWSQGGHTQAIWNPCSSGGPGCSTLIQWYPGLTAVPTNVNPDDDWELWYTVSAAYNPRSRACTIRSRSEDGGSCVVGPPLATNNSSSTTMSATTFSTLTTSFAGISLTGNSSATTMATSTGTFTGSTSLITTLSSTMSGAAAETISTDTLTAATNLITTLGSTESGSATLAATLAADTTLAADSSITLGTLSDTIVLLTSTAISSGAAMSTGVLSSSDSMLSSTVTDTTSLTTTGSSSSATLSPSSSIAFSSFSSTITSSMSTSSSSSTSSTSTSSLPASSTTTSSASSSTSTQISTSTTTTTTTSSSIIQTTTLITKTSAPVQVPITTKAAVTTPAVVKPSPTKKSGRKGIFGRGAFADAA